VVVEVLGFYYDIHFIPPLLCSAVPIIIIVVIIITVDVVAVNNKLLSLVAFLILVLLWKIVKLSEERRLLPLLLCKGQTTFHFSFPSSTSTTKEALLTLKEFSGEFHNN